MKIKTCAFSGYLLYPLAISSAQLLLLMVELSSSRDENQKTETQASWMQGQGFPKDRDQSLEKFCVESLQ